jgi:serine/threonine-protein kinase HipA
MTSIPVFYETLLVGEIDVSGPGEIAFRYSPTWHDTRGAFPLSTLAPLEGAGMEATGFTPWLANLLPEGPALEMVSRRLGASPGDILTILQAIGADTAGALSIGSPAKRGVPANSAALSETALEKIINDLPARPFLAGEAGVSMSLAGAQDKLPVCLTAQNEIVIPQNGNPSTHILKPDNPRLPGSVQNEALCMALAQLVGLRTASITTGKAGERTYLLVERYDRWKRPDGQWARLHQEDFCQALALPPSAKYEHSGMGIRGPRLMDLFGVVRTHLQATDRLQLLRAVIFNVLVTNVDSHAKNYSILLTGTRARLAPLYDLMCGDAWEHITQNMAQDIGGQRRGRHIMRRHWERFAVEASLTPRLVIGEIRKLGALVTRHLDEAARNVRAMPAGDHFMLEEFVKAIRTRTTRVLANLDAGGGQDNSPPLDDDGGKLISPL